jgi:hypothetical protein
MIIMTNTAETVSDKTANLRMLYFKKLLKNINCQKKNRFSVPAFLFQT